MPRKSNIGTRKLAQLYVKGQQAVMTTVQYATVTSVLFSSSPFSTFGGGGVAGRRFGWILRLVILPFVVIIGIIVCVPCESLLVESDDDLRTLDVGLSGGNQVGLVAVFPADTSGDNGLLSLQHFITRFLADTFPPL